MSGGCHGAFQASFATFIGEGCSALALAELFDRWDLIACCIVLHHLPLLPSAWFGHQGECAATCYRIIPGSCRYDL